MSQIGEYLRLGAAEMRRVLSDPDGAFDWLEEMFEAEDPRLIDIDKSWQGLAFVLGRSHIPEEIIYGDEEVPGAEEWGYTVPCMLKAERVQQFSRILSSIDSQDLLAALDFDELTEAGVYPVEIWNSVDRKWMSQHLDALIRFYKAASDEGMSVLMWRD